MADETFEVELRIDLNAPNLSGELSRALGGLNGQFTQFDGNIAKVQKRLDTTGQSSQKFAQNLSTTRYALYDVSSTLGIAGAAMLGLAVATTAVAIAWERDFANVARTSGLTGDSLSKLRSEFVDLAQTMPTAFKDLTQIGTLGSQLGVASKDLAGFTQTVVRFSTATGISAQESAMAFGRLGNILGVTAEEYERLGSSIAFAGLQAVATESEIVAVAQQIGPIARLSGVAADGVIGLATAMASVKIPPELARSVITKTFNDIQKAVETASPKLAAFGEVAGMSAAEFSKAWKTDATGTFVELLKGITLNGEGAYAALDKIGITSRRDTPAILKLAQNYGLVGESLRNSKQGWDDGTELARQYGIVADTTASKIAILVGNFTALLDAIGSANLGPLKSVLDGLSGFLGMLTDMASTDIGGSILGVATILAGLLGVLTLAAAGMALFGASSIGVSQAMIGLTATAPRAAAMILGAGNAAAVASGSMSAAAAGAKALGAALKVLSLIGVVLLIPDMSEGFQNMVNSVSGASTELEDRMAALKGSIQGVGYTLGLTNDVGASLGKAFADIGLPATEANRKIKELDDQIVELAGSGNIDQAKEKLDELRGIMEAGGISASQFKILAADALKAVGESAEGTNKGAINAASGLDELSTAEEVAVEQTQQLAAALGLIPEDLTVLQENLTAGSAAFFDFSTMLQSLQDASRAWAEAQSEATYGSKDHWQEFYDGASVNLADFSAALQAQIDAQASWATDLQLLSAQGATAFVTELARMGPEGAPLAAAAVNATSDELMKLESQARLAAFLASEAFAQGFTENTATLMEAYRQGGLEAVQALIDAQVSGAPGAVQQVIAAYNLQLSGNKMRLQATDADARGETQRFLNYVAAQRPTVRIIATYETVGAPALPDTQYSIFRKQATGGPVYGPGTATSDSIPTLLSNGEYVIRAAARQKYGDAFMNAVNSGKLPRFASGGPVSSSGGGGSSMMGGVIELGPKSLAAVSRSVINNILLDDDAISRSAERGNAKRRSTGEL